ncbi:redoxin domain-containing protein [Candidatus Nitronereus thalassa]|uniref:Redoxin domain-containing protein n=1 Tax=Candidatus Nitronereus thalassa TaxID=3020898 RepID=A0ABU3KCV4_9BACT|nr:redoxin domain-containing protein [Candidatus Nitronereus thalassa]MDT7044223.1 redoxin domain-containing protein [Candidatus Nitronereus thalassa]
MKNLFSTQQVKMVLLVCLGGLLAILALSPPLHAQTGIPAPDILNDVWLNSPPQRLKDLRGKVVMVEFWTFGCYNCRNIEPYVKQWHAKYADKGLVIIAIHSPEFSYERSTESVQQYINEHKLPYAVPIDNDFKTWKKYRNRYWPTLYLIDKQGIIQYVKIGEGGYAETDHQIRQLLEENSSPSS